MATHNPAAPPKRFRFGNTRIRTRLTLILLIPLAATAVLAADRIIDGARQANEARLVQSLAAVSVEASNAAHLLHQERLAAVALIADPGADPAAFSAQSTQADDAIAAYQTARNRLGEVPASVRARLAAIDVHLAGLGELRQQVLAEASPTASAVVLRYGAIARDVLAFQDSIVAIVEDPGLSEEIRAVTAISTARVHAVDAEAIAHLLAAGQELSGEQLTAFLATQTGQEAAFLEFGQVATPQQRAVVERAITGSAVEFAQAGTTSILQNDTDTDPQVLADSFAGVVDISRFVEQQLQRQLLASATTTQARVFEQVVTESAVILAALLGTIATAVLLAHTLARSLRRLRSRALAVAERDLPDTVARLADPRTLGENTPVQLAAQVGEPIPLRGRNEISEVGQAFNVVHRAAVRVAAEQAALRTSVSAMFLNLARRSQALVDRMISHLDEIERGEEDPKRLARMFTLDHLATRMRRNDENLLVLAGADTSPPRTEDALVTDVLRAAQSEVEHYDRIEFGIVDDDVSIVAQAVNDVVRLTAELFDNATRFSPPDAAVICEARRLGEHVVIQIEDSGLGLAGQTLDRLNAWLASPPELEVTTFRKMGLAVVARLAARHQIRVELRGTSHGGTIAYIALPAPILRLHRPRRPPTPAVPPPVPRSPLPLGHTPAQPSPALDARAPLPRRSPEVVRHAAGRNTRRGPDQPTSPRLARADLPVAGRPPALPPHPGSEPGDAAPPTPSTIELPIYQQVVDIVDTSWFGIHADPPPASHHRRAAESRAPTPPAPPADADLGDGWRTAADTGWAAAQAAAHPTSGGATASGLPKRRPLAQLVPGSVPTTTQAAASTVRQRSPEQVRGLLSAYHRGVQRGRDAGPR